MNKLYLLSIIALLSASSNAMAKDSSDGYLFSNSDAIPFAELKYSNIQADAKASTSTQSASETKSFDALSASVGIQFGRYFGMDANFGKGISKIKEVSGSTTYSTNLDSYFGVGLLGYLPLMNKLSLKGEVGERHYNFTVSDGTNNATGSDNHPYYLLGVQYQLNKSVYITGDYEHLYDLESTYTISSTNVKSKLNLNSINLGIRFNI